jgi:hypothetical protein
MDEKTEHLSMDEILELHHLGDLAQPTPAQKLRMEELRERNDRWFNKFLVIE